MKRLYFDWAATSPPDAPLLSRALEQSLTTYANPSSPHDDGKAARSALEAARARCAAVLGVPPRTLVFTSGGTESNNLALQPLLFSRAAERRLFVSAVEHPSVLEPARRSARLGLPPTLLRVERDGRVSPAQVASAVGECGGACQVAIQAVNNETGAVHDIAGAVAAVRSTPSGKRALFHCDAVQALGKVPLNVTAWGVDTASFSAHKIGGPRGVGILYAKKPFEALYSGGEQEGGLRAGTENLYGALAFAELLEAYAAPEPLAAARGTATRLMARLISALRAMRSVSLIPEDRLDADERFSPFILQAAFHGVPGEVLVRVLDDSGVSISTGSACSSASKKRPVLEAMGIGEKTAFEAVRFSIGRSTNENDIDELLERLAGALRNLA